MGSPINNGLSALQLLTPTRKNRSTKMMCAVFILFSDLLFNESIQSRMDDLASRLVKRVFIRSVKFAVAVEP